MDELRYPTGRFTRPDALTAECERLGRQDAILCRVTLSDVPGPFPREMALGLYRVAQEARERPGALGPHLEPEIVEREQQAVGGPLRVARRQHARQPAAHREVLSACDRRAQRGNAGGVVASRRSL